MIVLILAFVSFSAAFFACFLGGNCEQWGRRPFKYCWYCPFLKQLSSLYQTSMESAQISLHWSDRCKWQFSVGPDQPFLVVLTWYIYLTRRSWLVGSLNSLPFSLYVFLQPKATQFHHHCKVCFPSRDVTGSYAHLCQYRKQKLINFLQSLATYSVHEDLIKNILVIAISH